MLQIVDDRQGIHRRVGIQLAHIIMLHNMLCLTQNSYGHITMDITMQLCNNNQVLSYTAPHAAATQLIS